MNAEDELHLLLGRLIHAVGRLDHFIGLQLNWLGPYRGMPVADLLEVRRPFAHRLDALEPLVVETYGHSSSKAKRAFKSWFARAREAKAIRNDYAHGRWAIYERVSGESTVIEFMPLSWQLEPAKQPQPIRVSLSDFREEVETIRALTSEFMQIEQRFVQRVRPSAEWEAAVAATNRT